MKLLELQRAMAADVMRQGRRSPSAQYIRPNDRLTSAERLDIYRRQYTQRLVDSLRDDFPGLMVVLGSRRFTRISQDYIQDCPSTSFTLRDLGRHMEPWLAAHPEFTGERHGMAIDMARLEWAHIETFDGADAKAIGPEDLAELNPSMRLALQPHVRLLTVDHPVDEMRLRGKRLAGKRATCLATHRVDGDVYYRHLESGEYQLLRTISRGATLRTAVKSAAPDQDRLQVWFAAWAELVWLTRARDRSSARLPGQ